MSLVDGRGEWERLDPLMLLVQPIREVLRFLPALIGLFVAGTASGGMDARWQLLGIAVPVVLGIFRYLTTSYRITGERVELRRGLVSRHLLSTRLDRVRTVDLSSSPIQRLVGLSTVRIGTGTASTSDDDQIDLDGLPTAGARSLREDLLHRIRPVEIAPVVPPGEAAPDRRVLLVLDPSWARYAPLTSSGVLLTAATIGVASQVVEQLPGLAEGVDLDRASELSALLVVPAVLLVGAVVVTTLAVVHYLVNNWGFTLSHTGRDGTWHLSRGLLTTRETSIDEARLSGVSVGEPLGLRLAGAARLAAIVTGLDRSQQSGSLLVPPAPREVVTGVGAEVLGVAAPLHAPLRPHGPRAVHRRYSRALTPALVGAAALVALVAAGATAWFLVPAVLLPGAAVALAADRARALGHGLADGYVVARSGSLYRQRQALAVEDVIGWTFRATWFQRRAGLTSLVATTAGGPQAVTIMDVPEPHAVALAHEALPDLVAPFAAGDTAWVR
ncbi:MAG: PH domain-containing protein [Nocardioides sp.]